MSAPALEARGLEVTLDGVAIVRRVDLSVEPGSITALLGPSGAGKSTLFAALVGERRPTAGVVRLSGVDVTREPLWRRARRGLGWVPQTPSVLGDRTVRDNFATFAAVAVPRPTDRLGPDAWAARVGLAHRLDARASTLSGGERRRLELGRALLAAPTVLVCDEPFAGLDPAACATIGALLREAAARGCAVVLADHHVAQALAVCDRALLLVDGQVATSTTPAAFGDEPAVRARYLGTL